MLTNLGTITKCIIVFKGTKFYMDNSVSIRLEREFLCTLKITIKYLVIFFDEADIEIDHCLKEQTKTTGSNYGCRYQNALVTNSEFINYSYHIRSDSTRCALTDLLHICST